MAQYEERIPHPGNQQWKRQTTTVPVADEENNAEYLNGNGFPWEEAIEIAAWATFATEGSEYEQDTLPNVHIYII